MILKTGVEDDVGMHRCGYFTLDGNGALVMHGFPDITETTRCKLNIVDDGIIAIYPDDDLKREESIAFDETIRNTEVVINYFKQHNGVNVLFTKLYNCYFACPDIQVQRQL